MNEHDDTPRDGRLHELMGGAVIGGLTPAEQAELDALLAVDPQAREELTDLLALRSLLPGGPSAPGPIQPPGHLEERVVAAVQAAHGPPRPREAPARAESPPAGPAPSAPTRREPRARRRVPALAAAAATVVVAGAAGVGGWAYGARDEPLPTGPAGTLGAYEQIAFTGAPSGVEVDASVVAHTWGTETVMSISGLRQGSYSVAVLGESGDEVDSGTFIAPEAGLTDCRMIASLLREDADVIVVSDGRGREVMRSDLPDV